MNIPEGYEKVTSGDKFKGYKLPAKKAVRATSRASWKLIKDSDLLPKSCKKIINLLRRCTLPATAGEIELALQDRNAHKRFSELRNAGYIEECEARKCNVSGVISLTWKACLV